jgi:hypothetical protein
MMVLKSEEGLEFGIGRTFVQVPLLAMSVFLGKMYLLEIM